MSPSSSSVPTWTRASGGSRWPRRLPTWKGLFWRAVWRALATTRASPILRSRSSWTTKNRLVHAPRRAGRDPFFRTPRRRGADPAERLLRRGRVRARDRAEDADPGARAEGGPPSSGGAADRQRPAALHRRHAARRDRRE